MSKELQDLKIYGIANRLAWLQNNFYEYVIKSVDPFDFNAITGAQPIPSEEIVKRQQAQNEIDLINLVTIYNPATSYDINDRVIDDLGDVYKSLTNNNSGNALSDNSKWELDNNLTTDFNP